MSDRDLYIAAYDIRSHRRLCAALKLVKAYATGGQKSVFECFLTPGERRRLLGDMREVIEPEEDRFLLIRLDPRSRVHTLGIAVEPEDPPFFYHG
jgi:CRISPR-associated protein Cas2